MTQTNIDLTTHLGFQLSLMKLSTIPGPNCQKVEDVAREAKQLEALVNSVVTSSRV